MGDIVSKVVEIGLPYCVDDAKAQYRYLFRFGSFKDKLDEEVEQLKGVQTRVASRVKTDRMNGRTIYEDVENWLKDVRDILDEADCLKEEMKNKNECFMGRTCWYRLSKRFNSKTLEITQLRDKGNNYSEVSPPRAPLPIPRISSNDKDFMPFKSSKAALSQIMEGLKDESTKVIGLYGMGGVGKTTLAKQVIKSVENSKQFDKVVMVVVSQTPDIMAIQDKVAAVLGLKFEDEKDVSMKADRLSLRMEKEKKVLMILDDIWNVIDLPSIGIAFTADQKDCKLLITTRYRGVCSQMNCNKVVQINVMRKSEAWELFKEKAGLNDASPMIDTAKEVAKECGGLPIAIVPLAMALRNNTLNQWKDALQCLRNSNLLDIKNIEDKNAYKCVKVSYDKLNGEEIKFCFLMCSLFPEDHEIEIELLVRYAWGLCVYKYAGTIEEARIKVQSSVDHLKDYSLLLDTENKNKVKMHDVVRHFALWITSKQDNFFTAGYIESSNKLTVSESLETYMAVALIIKGIQEPPNGLVCQNLKLLLLCGNDATRVSYTFFEQMKSLKVLTIRSFSLAPYFPNISLNLRALCLEECKLGNISSIGNLKKLEIISFSGSDIRELPYEIGEMKELKVLDLSSCEDLERIPAGLVEKLSCLEELHVTCSRIKPWEARQVDTGSSGKACLSELNSLSKLSILSLDNIGECLLPDYFFLPNLTRYKITERRDRFTFNYPISQTLEIKEVNVTSLNAFKRFFSTVEHLEMKKNDDIQCIVPVMESGGFNNLISLELSFWKVMIYLTDTTGQKVPTTVFQNLKKLTLLKMDSLKELCGGKIPNKFLHKLETVRIEECLKLCKIFQVHEDVRNEDNFMLFSTLADLELSELPELTCVWEWPGEYINLNCLTCVRISSCKKLKSIFSLSMARTLVHLKRLEIKNCDELEHIFEEKEENGLEPSTSISHLSFTRLETVDIRNCNKLKYIFPIFVALSCLQQLEVLKLFNNVALEQIFKVADGNQTEIVLPQLEEMSIGGSPQLIKFSGGYCSTLSCPFLRWLFIYCDIQCPPRLEAKQLYFVGLVKAPKEWWNYISSQLVIGDLPNLKSIYIESLIGVEEIIRPEVDSQRSGLVLAIQQFRLRDLPQLAYICNSPSYTSVLKNLITLSISLCHKMSYIFSPTVAHNLPMLEYLAVEDCKELVQVIGNDNEGVPNHLKLEGFPSLKEIDIKNCNKIKFVFPLSVVGGLPNLEELNIQNADGLEYVFGNETLETRKEDVEKKEVVLPQLKKIVLEGLPNLRGFSVAGYNFTFPLLYKRDTHVMVGDCPKITERFSFSSSEGTPTRGEKASSTKAPP